MLRLGTAAILGAAATGAGATTVEARLQALGGSAPHPLRLLVPHGSEDNLAPVTRAFTALSGCTVEVQAVPLDDVATVLTLDRLSGDSQVDVALPATFAMPDLAEIGAISAFGDLPAQYEPSSLSAGMLYDKGNHFDGTRYGYQTDGDVYLMFVNQNLFDNPGERARFADRHGRDLDIPRTWEELDVQMRWFHRPQDGQFGGALFRSPARVVWEWWLRLHAKGVWPVSATVEPLFDSPEGRAALEELIAVTDAQFPHPTVLGEPFGEGRIYARLGWGGTQKQIQTGTGLRNRVLFAPPPGGRLGGADRPLPYFNWGWSYVVSSASTMQELSYLFCLFAVSPDISVQAVRRDAGFFDPFRAEHYDDPEIRSVYTDRFLDAHKTALADAIPDFYLPGRTRYFGKLGIWLHRALTGVVDVPTALAEAARDWRAITAEKTVERQSAHWQALREIYPADLRAALRDAG